MTVGDKVDAAVSFLENEMDIASGLMIINDPKNHGGPGGAPSNYWDNLPFGFKDAYSNAYFYQALDALAGIAEMKGDAAGVQKWNNLKTLVHTRYDQEFWDSNNGRYIGSKDRRGNSWDFGFTFVNTEALASGLGDASKAAAVYDWMDRRDPRAYMWAWAPTANTARIEGRSIPCSLGMSCFWWNGLGKGTAEEPFWEGPIGLHSSATFGQHLENGGAIFYTSHYDLMSRFKYFGADNARERFRGIMDEFKIDQLIRDPKNTSFLWVESYPGAGDWHQEWRDGPEWKIGLIGEYPENGLVPATFLYGFLGIDADYDGLEIFPKLSSDMTYASVKDLTYGKKNYSISVEDDAVYIETTDGKDDTSFILGNLKPETEYKVTHSNHTDGETFDAVIMSDAEGIILFKELKLAGSHQIKLELN